MNPGKKIAISIVLGLILGLGAGWKRASSARSGTTGISPADGSAPLQEAASAVLSPADFSNLQALEAIDRLRGMSWRPGLDEVLARIGKEADYHDPAVIRKINEIESEAWRAIVWNQLLERCIDKEGFEAAIDLADQAVSNGWEFDVLFKKAAKQDPDGFARLIGQRKPLFLADFLMGLAQEDPARARSIASALPKTTPDYARIQNAALVTFVASGDRVSNFRDALAAVPADVGSLGIAQQLASASADGASVQEQQGLITAVKDLPPGRRNPLLLSVATSDNLDPAVFGEAVKGMTSFDYQRQAVDAAMAGGQWRSNWLDQLPSEKLKKYAQSALARKKGRK